MTEDLRISMIQSHIIWEDREENLGYYGELLRRVSGRTDLAVPRDFPWTWRNKPIRWRARPYRL